MWGGGGFEGVEGAAGAGAGAGDDTDGRLSFTQPVATMTHWQNTARMLLTKTINSVMAH